MCLFGKLESEFGSCPEQVLQRASLRRRESRVSPKRNGRLLQVIYEAALRGSRLLHTVEACRLRPYDSMQQQLGMFGFMRQGLDTGISARTSGLPPTHLPLSTSRVLSAGIAYGASGRYENHD